MKKWETSYRGHSIVVENGYSRERLYVDAELQHENFGFGFRSELRGLIRGENTGDQPVKVILGGWFVQCRVFVGHRLVFHSKPDHTATAAIYENRKDAR
jgi:hypothetical protein